jgi:hypothetical protein
MHATHEIERSQARGKRHDANSVVGWLIGFFEPVPRSTAPQPNLGPTTRDGPTRLAGVIDMDMLSPATLVATRRRPLQCVGWCVDRLSLPFMEADEESK